MSEGIDYAWARPGGAAIKAAGKSFVMRYVEYPAAGGKGLRPDELADLHGSGLAVGMVFESDGLTPLQGAVAGDYDARQAATGLASIGWPADRPCYFAVDTDARSVDQLAAIDSYLIAAGQVLGSERIGVYGGIAVVDHCLSVGSAKWGWQTYAWSGGQVSTLAHVLQYSNGEWGDTVDFCRSLKDDFGQWPVEDEMTPEQARQLAAVYYTVYGGDPAVETDYLARQVGVAQSITSMEGALNRLAANLANLDQSTIQNAPELFVIANALIAAGNELKTR